MSFLNFLPNRASSVSHEAPPPKQHDNFATVSFGLAIFLFVLPVMADVAVGLMFARMYLAMVIWMASCYLLVAAPWIHSLRRHRNQPGVWAGGGYLIGIGIILGLHLLMLVATFVHWWAFADA